MQRWLAGGLIFVLLIVALPVGYAQEAAPPVKLGGYGQINDVAWSPDGTRIAVSTQTGIVLYDADLNENAFWESASEIKAGGTLAWSPDGAYLASGTGWHPTLGTHSDEATIWDAATGAIHQTLRVAEGEIVNTLSWNHAGDTILHVIQNPDSVQSLLLWNAVQRELSSVELTAEGLPTSMEWVWLPDDAQIEGVTRDERIIVDLAASEIVTREPYAHPDFIASPDGTHTAALDGGRLVVTTGDDTEYTFGSDAGSRFRGFREFAWAADSQKVVAWGRGVIPNLMVGEVGTGDTLLEITYEENGLITAARFSPDSTQLLVETLHDELLLYDLATGDVIAERWLSGGAISLSFNPNGSRIATVNGSRQAVYIWDALTGAEITKLVPEVDPLVAPSHFFTVAWSPDGTMIATGSNRGGAVTGVNEPGPIDLFIWDAASGVILQTVPAHAFEADYIARLAWSTDSRVLAYSTVSNQTGRSHFGAWDTVAEEMLIDVTLDAAHITDIALHPAGHLLAMGVVSSEPNTTGIQVVDLENIAWVNELPIISGGYAPYALDWHPNGEYLAAMFRADDVPAVRIWGPIEWPIVNHPPATRWFDFPIGDFTRPAAMVWSPAHEVLLAMSFAGDEASENRTGVQFWQVDPGTRQSQWVVGFGFTPDEMRGYSASGVYALDWSQDGSRFAESVTRSVTAIFTP